MVSLLFKVVPNYGQNTKSDITVADYAKWSTLQEETISPNGKWVSYVLHYDYANDTLFIQNIKSAVKLAFPDCSNPRFSKDGRWLTADDKVKGLMLRDQRTGNVQYLKDVIAYEFYGEGNYLSYLSKNKLTQKLTVLDLPKNCQHIFNDVIEFSANKEGIIAASTGKEVLLIEPGIRFKETQIAQSTEEGFKKLFWSENGENLAFFEEFKTPAGLTVNHRIFNYNRINGKTSILDPQHSTVVKDLTITTKALRFSDDGQRIFFIYNSPKIEALDNRYEIWDSESPLEYVQNKLYANPDILPKLAVWSTLSKIIGKIGTSEKPTAILTSNREYALCYDLLKYEPQYEYYAPADMYIKNTSTGQESLILKKQSTALGMIGNSPKGNYIHYFRDKNWWVYDIKKGRHQNLTVNLPASFVNAEDNDAGPPSSYDSPGWSADEKFFLAYDQYDIWLIAIDGSHSRKITDGSKVRVRYRICLDLYKPAKKLSTDEFLVRSFDLSLGLYVEAVGENKSSGFFRWNPDGTLTKMIYENSSNDRIQKSESSNAFIYVTQTATAAPRLMSLVNGMKSKMLFQSNPQASRFNWGQAELISYKDKNGTPLKGILYKPAGYSDTKKYPMVVYIYQRLSQGFHVYYPPTEYNPTGFTPSNYFLDGYLVLLPDIQYSIGDPGLSALDCVESAVNVVKNMGIVDKNRIGIIGHSYGGYETAFIITQSKTFAVAVCGSGIMNTVSSYFTYAGGIRRSNAWRFESQQGRMAFSPFDDWNKYERNAALPNAASCETPLLSWAGKKDTSVSWSQSAEFHMALRRLHKKNIFIVYPSEGHVISTPELQKDLTAKSKNWFDFYLKGKKLTILQ